MSIKKTGRALRALVALMHIMSPLGIQPVLASNATMHLPPPAVSKALDAILLPITTNVAKKFKLIHKKGLLVLAVQPGGVADKRGIKPGDVLVEVGGRPVRKPIDVDVAVRRGLKAGNTNYAFDVNRAGTTIAVAAVITLALYEEAFSVSEISTWESWSSSSFDYSEFVSEYSETIETSYESEETTVEQEISQEESSGEEATTDSDNDGTADAVDDDDDNDGTADEADNDDDGDGTADDADDTDGDEDASDAADDSSDDASDADDKTDDGSDDATGADDSSGDDGGDSADDGADDGDAGDDDAGGNDNDGGESGDGGDE